MVIKIINTRDGTRGSKEWVGINTTYIIYILFYIQCYVLYTCWVWVYRDGGFGYRPQRLAPQ